MKQSGKYNSSFYIYKKSRKGEHGGAHSIQRRRARRAIRVNRPLHITLRSDLAKGERSLQNHKFLIFLILKRASFRFNIRIYQKAICGNHIHLLIKGKSRVGIQNFFRVIAGHIAQEILREFPLSAKETERVENYRVRKNSEKYSMKNRRKFWDLLLWSRRVTFGRDFKNVTNYVIQNFLEALCIIPYRKRSRFSNRFQSSA